MRTTGERVRQARLYRKLTGEQLAVRAGYKNQSAIGNLENRSTGRGGFRLPKIAQVLGFPLEWFLNGPDYDDLAVLEERLRHQPQQQGYAPQERTEHLTALLGQLNAEGVDRAVEYVELLQYKYRRDDAAADEAALAGATVKDQQPPTRGKKAA